MPEVIVDVSPEGEVKVEANGVVGSGCQQLTKAIEQSIGKTTGDQKKPEFHQTAAAVAKKTATQ
ncbi:MAG: DUF2997 domain-containing protein [Planctomycetaceae bacterium]|nr:DUF2997 domain-containing protein [Planctomycetaceae bacterium]